MKNYNKKNYEFQDKIYNEDSKHLEKPTKLKKSRKSFVENMEDKGIKMERLEKCGNFLLFQTNADKNKFLLSGGNFCNNRFCPTCAWLKAKKTAFKLLELLKVVEHCENKRFLFVTLTVPNCKGEDLDYTIKFINASFQRLSQRKAIKKMNSGFIRKLEVTYNEERNDYHPHLHLIFSVNKSYFKDTKIYITHAKLLELWQESTRNKNITQVDIRPCRMNSIKEILEIATYSTKFKDLLNCKEVFDYFYLGLKGKQIIVYSGIFKKYKKLLELNEIELDEIEELAKLREETLYEILYLWNLESEIYDPVKLNELEENSRKFIYDLELSID